MAANHPAPAELFARESGNGPTVLLLHGFAEASATLQAMRVGTLNHTGWNAAALDLRAYGKSGGSFASFGGREEQDSLCPHPLGYQVARRHNRE